MSQLLARVMLAIFMLPCASVIYIVTVMCVDEAQWMSYPYHRYRMWISAGIVAWAFIAGYWTLLWRSSVRWTPGRRRNTLLVTGSSILVAALVAGLLTRVDEGFGIWVGTVTAPLLWLIQTTLVWRETAGERRDRVSGASALTCPTCGYNLTGLQSTRCPECGTQFTVDELNSRQKSAAEPELTS